jgi:hypothetical protein
MEEIIRHIMELYEIDEESAKKRVERVLQEEIMKRNIYDAVHWFDTWGDDDSYEKEYAHLSNKEGARSGSMTLMQLSRATLELVKQMSAEMQGMRDDMRAGFDRIDQRLDRMLPKVD